VVTAASISDKAGAKIVLIKLFDAFSTLKIMWADTGYNGKPLARYAQAVAAITVEVVARASPHSFQVLRRRWVVERTLGWLMRYRRLARDYERTTANSEAMIYWATIIIMTRRLTRYENGQPPIRRWGGERPCPSEQPAYLQALSGAKSRVCGSSRSSLSGSTRTAGVPGTVPVKPDIGGPGRREQPLVIDHPRQRPALDEFGDHVRAPRLADDIADSCHPRMGDPRRSPNPTEHPRIGILRGECLPRREPPYLPDHDLAVKQHVPRPPDRSRSFAADRRCELVPAGDHPLIPGDDHCWPP
jgi:transposase